MIHFIYNPVAGGGKASAARRSIEPLLGGAPHAFHETCAPGDAKRVAREITEGEREATVVAMGGDGTLNEVLNGIADPAAAQLGLIPCGSGNDFAAATGIPTDPRAAADILLSGEARFTDFMECSGVRGINAIGTGIDVDILRRYQRMRLLKGSPAYLASLIMTVAVYRARRFEDVTGDTPVPHCALIACAGNGQSIGGGIPICPEAQVDDGLLDVVIVDDIARHAIPAALIKLMCRRVGDISTARQSRQQRLTIASDIPMPVQIDGEIYDDLPFDVRLIHGVLRFYRP